MTTQVEKVLSTAKSQVGYKEGYSGGHWNNDQKYSKEVPGMAWSNYQAWCCTFVSWVAYKAGVSSLFPRTAGCSMAVSWFKNEGRFSEYPAIGSQVFYGSGGSAHTGVVYAYDSTYIYTYEGNTNTNGSPEGDGVYAKKRVRKDSYVYGYGLPKYTEGITTADPNKKGKAGFTYAAAASAPASSAKTKVVTVKNGQTLGAIASAAGVSLAVVLGLNPSVKNPNVIHPGDHITVPATPPSASTKPSPKPTPKPTTKPKPAPKPKPKPAPKAPAFPGARYFKAGANNAYVTELGKALVRHGYGRYYAVGPGPRWSNSDRNPVRANQRAQGWSGSGADGYPGPETWARLMK